MQVSVLRQSIIFQRHPTQPLGDLGVNPAPVTGHAQHIAGITAGLTGRNGILFERFHSFQELAVVIERRAQDALHLDSMHIGGMRREIILRHDFGLVILLLGQVDFGNVIRYQRFVLLIFLQAEKALQRLIITLLRIAYVRKIICAVGSIARRSGPQRLEPDGSLSQVTRQQVTSGQAIRHIVTLVGSQPVQTRLPEGLQGLLIVFVKEISGSNKCLYAVGVRSVGIFRQETSEQVRALRVTQFISGTGQHVGRLFGSGIVTVAGIALQVSPQGRDGGRIGFLFKQHAAFRIKFLGSGLLFETLCQSCRRIATKSQPQ